MHFRSPYDTFNPIVLRCRIYNIRAFPIFQILTSVSDHTTYVYPLLVFNRCRFVKNIRMILLIGHDIRIAYMQIRNVYL